MGSTASPGRFVKNLPPGHKLQQGQDDQKRTQRRRPSAGRFVRNLPDSFSTAQDGLSEEARRARALKTGVGIEEFAPGAGPPDVQFEPKPLLGTELLDELAGRVTGVAERLETATRPDPRIQATIEEEERLGLPAGTGPLSQERAQDVFKTLSESPPEQVEALEGVLSDITAVTGAGKVLQFGRKLAGKTFFSTLERLGPRAAQTLARSIRGATEVGVIEAVCHFGDHAVNRVEVVAAGG